MKQSRQPGQYDSYLLRIWRGREPKDGRWMLQNIRTGEQKGFRDMNALVQFLDAKYGETQGQGSVELGEWKGLEIGD